MTTFSIKTLSIKGLFATLSIMTFSITAHWCHYAECHILFIVMLSVVMLSVAAPMIHLQHKLHLRLSLTIVKIFVQYRPLVVSNALHNHADLTDKVLLLKLIVLISLQGNSRPWLQLIHSLGQIGAS